MHPLSQSSSPGATVAANHETVGVPDRQGLQEQKGGAAGAGHKRHLFRSALVLAQIAVCVIVLVCGGLFVRSLQELAEFNLGFRTDHLLMASVDLGLQGYVQDKGRRFLEQLTDGVQALPGVESAAIASSVPFDTYFDTHIVLSADHAAGPDPTTRDDEVRAGVNRVGPGYFHTMGVTLLQGREFTDHDRDSSRRVAIVNQTLADRLWPGQQPLGKQFQWKSSTDPIEVVGVVSNGKYVLLGEAPRPYIYLPFAQEYSTLVTLHGRTQTADPLALAPAVRRVFGDLDPDLPVFNVRTMSEHLRSSAFAFLPLRMGAILAGAQGVVALLLAMIGIYGVVAYSVRQQTHDIGIRVALRAPPRRASPRLPRRSTASSHRIGARPRGFVRSGALAGWIAVRAKPDEHPRLHGRSRASA
jgi:predicted permease